MGKFSRAKVDRASGGVVVRQGNDGPEVLVVHRPRYDDWALPKGHVDPGESWAEAALREVLEETAVCAAVAGDPVSVAYMLEPTQKSEVAKVVVFFPMTVVELSDLPIDRNEVDAVDWWTLDRCRAELSYADEMAVIVRLSPA
ncbi:MAG: NUDIX hydrolase [Actinomycetia bacterium]|nr:NUDIX hydrolase [Actinomycetes bacterium]MCP4962218.1 NUDIX hydrolase [Actinomycetes bacterium]